MPYTVVKSFERGIDTRKLLDTTEPGALLDARDCHLTLGGELEKRAAFVVKATLPDTTVGLYVTEGRVYHTWGDAVDPPAGLPAGTVYHSIPDPDGSPLKYILQVEFFNGKLYVVAQYEDGDVFHWYEGLQKVKPVPPVGDGSGGIVTPPPDTPGGKPFVNFECQPTDASTSPDIIVSYVYLLSPTTTYTFGTDAFMAIAEDGVSGGFPYQNTQILVGATRGEQVVAQIMHLLNTATNLPTDVQATTESGSDFVKIFVNDAGTTYNGWKIQLSATNCRFNPSNNEALSGGTAPTPAPSTTAYTAPPRSGAVGDPIDKGPFVLAHNMRMFSVQGNLLNYTIEEDATVWERSDDEAGNINMSMITAKDPILVSLADYRGDLAVFGARVIIIMHMDFVISQSFKRQTIHGTGTFAPHSVTPYGEGEVMYLDTSGIRSLRARDSTDMGFAADIGNFIDDLVKQKIAASTAEQKYHFFWGVVDPRTSRLWMALYDKIFVLTYYPSSRINAWTWYDATSAPVTMMNASDDSIYWRSGNDIICYGDEDGTVYDDTEALARLPYIDAGKVATWKNWQSLDTALYGTWQIRGSFDPTQPTALDLLANVSKSTYQQQKLAMNGESPAVSLEFRSTFVGPARIGNATVHYTDSVAE